MNALNSHPSNMSALFVVEPEMASPETVHFPGGYIDFVRNEVVYEDGQRLELSGRESALLRYMATHPNRILQRAELLIHVWEMHSPYIVTRTIDMHVAKLRDKLRDDPLHPKVLLTIRGKGYVFVSSAKEQDADAEADAEATVKGPTAVAVCC